jgi:hypothetical protein
VSEYPVDRSWSEADASSGITVDIIGEALPGVGFVTGRLLTVASPEGRVSILPPVAGCGNGTSFVHETARAAGCSAATNGGFFDETTLACLGNVVSRGTVVQRGTTRNANFGFRNGSIVTGYLTPDEVVAQDGGGGGGGGGGKGAFTELVAGVVWLVRDGASFVSKSMEMEDMKTQNTGRSFADVMSARTAIGHDAKGRVMVLHVDGKTWSSRGIDLFSLANLLVSLGAVNAINLDGGGSSSMVLNGTLVSLPSDTCPLSHSMRCEREVTTTVCVTERRCHAGTFRPPLSTDCADCPAGRFSGADDARACALCAPGTAQHRPGRVECPLCRAGRFSDQAESFQCTVCPAGRFAPTEGATECTDCPGGMLCARDATSRPLPCTVEGYAAGAEEVIVPFCPNGSIVAALAPPGWFSSGGHDNSSATSIQACDAGDACAGGVARRCAPGQFTPTTGASVCRRCVAGRYSSSSGAAACASCPTGTFSGTPGSTNCTQCPVDHETPHNGSTRCQRRDQTPPGELRTGLWLMGLAWVCTTAALLHAHLESIRHLARRIFPRSAASREKRGVCGRRAAVASWFGFGGGRSGRSATVKFTKLGHDIESDDIELIRERSDWDVDRDGGEEGGRKGERDASPAARGSHQMTGGQGGQKVQANDDAELEGDARGLSKIRQDSSEEEGQKR